MIRFTFIISKLMEVYKSLLVMMDAESRADIKKECLKESSLKTKIILELLNNIAIEQKALIRKFSISEGTLNKTLTAVKEFLWDHQKQKFNTPYDDIFMLRQLLLAGEIKNGAKVFYALKKEYETQQLWHQLDLLYLEGFRIAQIAGDEKLIGELSAERKNNNERLYKYIDLSSEIMLEMVRLEGHKLRKPDLKKYELHLQSLYARSLKLGHYLLIHNTLHLQYLFSTHYKNDPAEVFRIISMVNKNAETNANAINEMTRAIALNNYVNFLTIYKNFGDPEVPAKKLKRIISAGGDLAVANFYYGMLEYSLFEKKLADVNFWLEELKKRVDTSKFAQYRYIILAIKGFVEKNYKEFKDNFNQFYRDASHLDFPDLEITLRLLDIMHNIQKEEGDIVSSKADALRIYMGRNTHKERYADERMILSVLSRINEGNRNFKKELVVLDRSYYRNIGLLVSLIRDLLLS